MADIDDLYSGLPGGLVAYGAGATCTLKLCPAEWSIMGYRPSIPASATFIALFAVAMLVHAGLGIWFRRWGYMASIICGCILEIIGYAARIILNNNPFDFNGFIMQIVCITIAPLFYCAAIYVMLSQVVIQVDPSLSRFKPSLFYWIFIPCDVVSLVLQSVGGAMSSMSSTQSGVDMGVDISLAGLIFQVVVIATFCAFFADYLISCRRRGAWTKVDARMKFFLTFLFIAILLILMRCAYRIVELREGYGGEMFRDQPLFIGLESVPITIAVFCLAIGHPGFAMNSRRQSRRKSSAEVAETSDQYSASK